MPSITLYGIKNCDRVKKTCRWLHKNHIKYTLHDFRVDGINMSIVNKFLENIETKKLINKRSTSWKKLSEKEKNTRTKSATIKLLLDNPTIIKRPIIKSKEKYFIVSDEEKLKLLK